MKTGTRLDALQAFLRMDPDDPFTRYAIGLEYVSLNRPEEAIASFEDVIRRDLTYVPAYHQLGLLLMRLGKKADAAAVLKQGITAARASGDRHAEEEMQETLGDIQSPQG